MPPVPGFPPLFAIPRHTILSSSPWTVPCSIFWNKEAFISSHTGGNKQNNVLEDFYVLVSPPSLPARALHVSGVLEMSSSDTMDRLCSAEGLLRGGGNGEISVSLVSWASVSRRRRRLRLLLGVVRDRRDTAFFMAGLSFWSIKKKKKKGEGKDGLVRPDKKRVWAQTTQRWPENYQEKKT